MLYFAKRAAFLLPLLLGSALAGLAQVPAPLAFDALHKQVVARAGQTKHASQIATNVVVEIKERDRRRHAARRVPCAKSCVLERGAERRGNKSGANSTHPAEAPRSALEENTPSRAGWARARSVSSN